jgi:hypothetical protein
MCLFTPSFIYFMCQIFISMFELNHHDASVFLKQFKIDLNATLMFFHLLTTQLLLTSIRYPLSARQHMLIRLVKILIAITLLIFSNHQVQSSIH